MIQDTIKNFINIFREYPDTSAKIIGRLGKTGSGKTLDQTEQDVIPALLNGEEVWCSYWINWNGPNIHYFNPDDFDAIANVRNAVIVFDEIRQSFDPRRWESEDEQVRTFFEMHRKRHNDIIFNTQDVSLVAKTIGIQAHQWAQVERVKDSILKRVWYNISRHEGITIRKDYLTFQELKKIANGWELGEDVAIDADWEITHYRAQNLIHHELDDYKVELVHRYCPICQSRQGEMIKKEDTNKVCKKDEKGNWILRQKEFCPKHPKEKLEIKESGIYDTDYEPIRIEKELIWVPLVDCKKGERKVRYNGPLSERQEKLRQELNNLSRNLDSDGRDNDDELE